METGDDSITLGLQTDVEKPEPILCHCRGHKLLLLFFWLRDEINSV